MTRRMSGREADFEFHAAQSQNLSLIKINRRFGTGVDVEAEERAAAACPPQDMIVRMQRHQRQRIQRIGNGARAADVVEVGVRIPEMSDPPAAFLRLRQNDVTIPGRVDHGGFFCFRSPQRDRRSSGQDLM